MVEAIGVPQDAALRRISDILRRRRGLDLTGYKSPCVSRRIWTRVRALRLDDLSAYADHLAGHAEETDRLLSAVTINVTEFFRTERLFQALEKSVIPELVREAAPRPVQAWCAGCATGEEVYSLALLFRRVDPRRTRPVRILATDIDAQALEAARKGSYPVERLRRVSAGERANLFEKGDDRRLEVGPALRGLCRFEQANILRDRPPAEIDLLLCRNVLIFLGEAQQQRALAVFARALRPGGILVLGAVERVIGEAERLFAPVDRIQKIYRRIDTARGTA